MNSPPQREAARATLERALGDLQDQVGRVELRALGQWGGEVVIERAWGCASTDQLAWAIDCGEQAQAARGERWCARAPLARQINQLSAIHDDVGQDELAELGHQCHAFLAEGETVLGHLVAERLPARPLRRVVLRELRAALETWRGSFTDGQGEAYLLLSASGRLLSHSSEALELLGCSWEDASQQLRDVIDDPRLSSPRFGPYFVAFHPLVSDERQAHLVSLEHSAALSIQWSHALDDRKLKIARLALDGLNNPEIAAQLSISRNTVKYHFKGIYQRLGVGSRAELAVLLGPKLEPCQR